jgi:AcrR family transcriptional regulator
VSRIAGATTRADSVLDEVERRFRTTGPRGLVMSDLARSQSMSTKTLYRLFPSKEALILAVVRRWCDGLLAAQDRRNDSDMTARERISTAIQALVAHRRRFSPDFWAELRDEHPEAWSLHTETLARARRRAEGWMQAARRSDVDAHVARLSLLALVELAQRSDLLEATGLELAESIDQLAGIWARGVLLAPDDPPPRS